MEGAYSGCYCEAVKACPHDPMTMMGQPIGMYHCPGCGDMQVAGFPHTKTCIDCVELPNELKQEYKK